MGRKRPCGIFNTSIFHKNPRAIYQDNNMIKSKKSYSNYSLQNKVKPRFVTSLKGLDLKESSPKHITFMPRFQQIDHDTYELVEAPAHGNAQRHLKNITHTSVGQDVCNHSVACLNNELKTVNDLSTVSPGSSFSRQSRTNLCIDKMDSLRSYITVSGDQMAEYFRLLETPIIKKFYSYDICLRVTDKYLTAMAFAYFARAKLQQSEYTTLNFFAALYLAHDVEEDEEEYKYEIFPWALGKFWKVRYKSFLDLKDTLWKKMDYRAIVSKRCCEEIMAIEPSHPVWKRERKEHHAGAIRPWLKDKHDDGKLIGPDGTPRHCELCNYPPNIQKSEYNSSSSLKSQIWLQMDTSSSSMEEFVPADITNSSARNTGLCMNELHQTLMCSSAKTSSSGKGRSITSGDNTLDWVDCFSDIGSPYGHEP